MFRVRSRLISSCLVVDPDRFHELRNCEGVRPVSFLKVELNDAFELNPESKAMAIRVK